MKVSLPSQIAAVQREIAQRDKVYPRLVSKGTMRQSEAEMHIAHMQAVLTTLLWLQANESDVRAFIAARRQTQDGGRS